MDIEVLKQKHAREWQECGGDEKLFLKLINLKEKEKRLREEIRKKSEIERRREARALIILAKLFIKDEPHLVKQMIDKHQDEFLQKERNQTIDYSRYILSILEDKNKSPKP